MSDFYDDTIIMRYMPLKYFFDLLKTNELHMAVALAHEDTDINEGRFTDDFVKKVISLITYQEKKNYVQMQETIPSREDVEGAIVEDLEISLQGRLTSLLATRENSYLSCWTCSCEENLKMWNSFADEGRGVAIISKVRKVRNAIETLRDSHSDYFDEDYRIYSDRIIYERKNLASFFNEDYIHDSTFPMFFLDSGTFEHEEEYRFLVYNVQEVIDTANEIEISDCFQFKGNYIHDINLDARRKGKETSFLRCSMDIDKTIDSILLGPKILGSDLSKIKRSLKYSSLLNKIKKSKFTKK